MEDALRISLATESDVPAITRLLDHAESPFDVHAELLRRYARLWVAATSEGPVGFLLAWHVADEVQLLDLVVDPRHRRRGFGRALVARLKTFAVEQGARIVLLEVRTTNLPAIALYRAFDFAVTGERANYYASGEAALEMQLELRY